MADCGRKSSMSPGPPGGAAAGTGGPCSTPFGITEVGIQGGGEAVGGIGACSTPFGITEVGMRCPQRIASLPLGAQRLSASLKSACA